MIINSKFTKQQYIDLQNKIKFTNKLNKKFIQDVFCEKLEDRLNKLIPEKYINDNIEYYYISDNIISSWINLINEWTCRNIRSDITTYIYWARIKRHTNHIKIGITYDVIKRSEFENNKYYDYHVIRWCKNRYIAAYIEYKVRTLFCNTKSEIININDLGTVIDYINNLHYTKDIKQELELLGWNFK